MLRACHVISNSLYEDGFYFFIQKLFFFSNKSISFWNILCAPVIEKINNKNQSCGGVIKFKLSDGIEACVMISKTSIALKMYCLPLVFLII